MIRNNTKKIVCFAEIVFKFLLFIYAALGACNLTYGKPVISWVMNITFILGAVLVLIRVLSFRSFDKMPGRICAVLLWCTGLFSCMVNMQYFSKSNLLYLILWAFYFFLLYTQPNGKKIEELKSEYNVASVIFLILNTILVCISLYMFATGYEHVYRDPGNNGYEVASGIFTGRLWGAYQDPNLGSIMSCVAIALCGYWFVKKSNIFLRSFLVVDSLLTLGYIAFSDSRNGMVCMGVLFALSFALSWFRKSEQNKRHIVIGIIVMVVLLGCGTALPKVIQNGYNQIVELSDDDEDHAVIKRNYDMEGDISNRRFDVWSAGLTVGTSNPVFGVSYAGMLPYAKEYMKDSLIADEEQWVFNTFDNELINIFAFNGIIALAVVLIWFALAVKWVFTNMKYISEKHRAEINAWIIIVCIYVVSALFQGTMFYQTTPNTIFFWMIFGTLAIALNGLKEEASN